MKTIKKIAAILLAFAALSAAAAPACHAAQAQPLVKSLNTYYIYGDSSRRPFLVMEFNPDFFDDDEKYYNPFVGVDYELKDELGNTLFSCTYQESISSSIEGQAICLGNFLIFTYKQDFSNPLATVNLHFPEGAFSAEDAAEKSPAIDYTCSVKDFHGGRPFLSCPQCLSPNEKCELTAYIPSDNTGTVTVSSVSAADADADRPAFTLKDNTVHTRRAGSGTIYLLVDGEAVDEVEIFVVPRRIDSFINLVKVSFGDLFINSGKAGATLLSAIAGAGLTMAFPFILLATVIIYFPAIFAGF